MLILSIKPVHIIVLVNLLHVFTEVVERLHVPLVVEHGKPNLAERVESFQAREDETVVFKRIAQRFGDFMRHGSIDGTVNYPRRLVNDFSGAWVSELRDIKAASVIYHLCGIVEKSRIERGSLAALAVCQREGIVLVELEQCRVKRPVRAAQVCGLRGAYLKKLSGCVFA